MIWKVEELIASANECRVRGALVDYPGRPIAPSWAWRTRIKAAWLVLRGRADAVVWPMGQ